MSLAPKDLHAAEQALAGIEAIRQVVQTVWTLARAQQQRVELAAIEAVNYLEWVDDLVGRFASERLDEAPGSALWIVVGPERPFCGGIARRLLEQVPEEGALMIVGQRLADAVSASESQRARIVSFLPAAAAPEEIDGCARRIATALLGLDFAGPVGLIHPRHAGTEVERIPLLAAAPLDSQRAPETYSSAEVVLAASIHEALSGRLVVGLAEGLRSEVRARLMAADAARQGADRKLDVLRQHWRVLRQEMITSELLELFSGRLSDLE